ncbi:MAG: hypothetical protein MET45_27505 [Nostoc sp. LLA-1]|nr:hypothetical protein [Cyanocohniella sp. LLY]
MKALVFCLVLLGLVSCANNDNNQASADTNNNLVAVDTSDTPVKTEFIASGTEPFWSVDVSKKEIVYSSLLDDQKQTFPYVEPLTASGRLADLVRVYRLSGKDGDNNILIIRKVDVCSDGMSDNQYPYSALFIQDDMVLEGCAR